jgi:DNA-binding PadR family transcriptional regulator
MYVDPELRFLRLKNLQARASWSVQIDDATVFYYKLTPNGVKQVEARRRGEDPDAFQPTPEQIRAFMDAMQPKVKVTKLGS